jgi:hypothetical protein
MFSLFITMYKKATHHYHKLMYSYHSVLHRDCHDHQMKMKLYKKVKYHESRIH